MKNNIIETVETTSDIHAWNLVKLHGYWYNVDVTWADTDWEDIPVYYDYYLKSDVTLLENDEDSSHVREGYWEGVAPEARYDSSELSHEYASSYFVEGNFTYFKINDNSNLAGYMATVVDATSGAVADDAPSMVKNNDKTYTIYAPIVEIPSEEEPGTGETTLKTVRVKFVI